MDSRVSDKKNVILAIHQKIEKQLQKFGIEMAVRGDILKETQGDFQKHLDKVEKERLGLEKLNSQLEAKREKLIGVCDSRQTKIDNIRQVRKELVAKKKLEFERLTKENLVLTKDGGKWGMEWVDKKFEKYKLEKAEDEKKFAAEVESLKGPKPIEYKPLPFVEIPRKSKKPDKKPDINKIAVKKVKEVKNTSLKHS